MQTAHTFSDRILALVRDNRRARLLVYVCVATFLVLALAAISQEKLLLKVDTAVQEGTMEVRTGWLNTTMVMLTELGTRYVIGVLAVGLAIWARVTKRCTTTLVVIIAAVAINPVFEVLFKELVGRIRPNLDQLLPGNGPSFPSGHVLASVGFYGIIPLVVWEALPRRPLDHRCGGRAAAGNRPRRRDVPRPQRARTAQRPELLRGVEVFGRRTARPASGARRPAVSSTINEASSHEMWFMLGSAASRPNVPHFRFGGSRRLLGPLRPCAYQHAEK